MKELNFMRIRGKSLNSKSVIFIEAESFNMSCWASWAMVLAAIILMYGCEKGHESEPAYTDQMVLIYIAANNDLKLEALNSVNELERGYLERFNLLVYLKTTSETSVILKIKADNTPEIVSDTIAVYGNENSSDPYFLSRVVSNARKLSPASSYGLVLWSHASSWAPPLGGKAKILWSRQWLGDGYCRFEKSVAFRFSIHYFRRLLNG